MSDDREDGMTASEAHRRPRRKARDEGRKTAERATSARPRKQGSRRERGAEREQAQPPEEPTHAPSAEAVALVEEFASQQPFPLDPFQVEAARHLADGRSVLVAAPTGTGKTVVAEVGIWLARRTGQRAIYTAPLKALSNQKFRDLRAYYGEGQVGLLTGDIVEYPRAPIVVMTTEIYRNMLLEGVRAAQLAPGEEARQLLAPLARQVPDAAATAAPADDVAELARSAALDEQLSTVGCVIFDELHYLSDPQRGPVWEEAIIHSPAHVQLVGLSATVSNADELRRWIESVHGSTALVFTTERAVPLEHYFYFDGKLHLVQNAAGQRLARFPGVGGEAKLARQRARWRRYVSPAQDEGEPSARITIGGKPWRGRPADGTPSPDAGTPPPSIGASGGRPSEDASAVGASGGRPAGEPEEPAPRPAPEAGEILAALRDAGLLPSLYFLPGRRAVETAAESAKGHLLVSPEDRSRLHAEVQEWVQALPADDRKLDQVQRLAALLPRGLAFHHAGLLPGLKVMVETLFQRGELKAVFATDTLALGINMPARSVTLGSLSKFDGTQMRLLTPNEYQQLTGRAGRRGMDAMGAAVIPYSPWDPFEEAFAALTAPLLPVTSAFIIRYNSVLNLWSPGDPERLRMAVAASFREFQRRHGRAIEYGISRRGYRGQSAIGETAGRFRLSRAAAAELEGVVYVLRYLGYIGKDDELTVKGRLLRAIFHPVGILLTELIVNGALDGLTPPELAEVVSWFTFDDDRPLRNYDQPSQRLQDARREVYNTLRDVLGVESEEGLALSPGIVESFHGVALSWHRGYSLGGLLRRIDLAEGDLLVSLNQTIDLLQQVQGAVGQTLDAKDIWRSAAKDTRFGRWLAGLRERLETLRPLLDAAWRGMLRGSVAQSRAIPSMVAGPPAPDLPPIPMAEDEDPELARSDRVDIETPPAEGPLPAPSRRPRSSRRAEHGQQRGTE